MDPDKLLKSAKHNTPPLPVNFSATLMKEIDKRKLVIKQVKKSVLKNAVNLILSILTVLTGIILINAVIFEIKMNGSLELLNFENEFILDFLSQVPYDLIFYSAAFIIGGILFLRTNERLQQIAITNLSIIVVIISGIGGTALANSGVNENLQELELQGEINIPLMHHFYVNRARYDLAHNNVMIGLVKKVSENTAFIETPSGENINILLPEGTNVKQGEYIRIKGTKNSLNAFNAEIIQHCNSEKIRKYYNHHQNMDKHHGMMNMM